METKSEQKRLADRAFWEIDAIVAQVFEEAVMDEGLPTHDERGRKHQCRSLDRRPRRYERIYYKSVDKACALVKIADPVAYKLLVDEYGGEKILISQLKYA